MRYFKNLLDRFLDIIVFVIFMIIFLVGYISQFWVVYWLFTERVLLLDLLKFSDWVVEQLNKSH